MRHLKDNKRVMLEVPSRKQSNDRAQMTLVSFVFMVLFLLFALPGDIHATSLATIDNQNDLHLESDSAYDEEIKKLDPLEPLNRGLYGIHFVIDGMIIAPLAYLYQDTVADPIKNSVSNFISNLFTPLTMLNNLLTFDIEAFGDSFSRLFINTTIGLFGLFDPAAEVFGIQPKSQTLNDTLQTWGVSSGPYLFLPIIGPSNFRDSCGRIGDYYGDPFNILMVENDSRNWIYIRAGASGFDKRRKALDITRQIYATPDPYAQFRSLYMQHTGMIDSAAAQGPIPSDVDLSNESSQTK